MRRVASTAVAAILAAQTAAAQIEPEGLRVGQRLRVVATDAQQSAVGRLLAIAHDTLWLRRPDEHDTLRYLSPMIRQLQAARGMTRNEGAITGATIGFVGILAIASYHPRSTQTVTTCLDCNVEHSRVWLIPVATAGGAIAGALFARNGWFDVRWPPVGLWAPESADRSLVRGRHVRIDTGSGRFTARMLERRGDTLVLLATDRNRDTLYVSAATITAIAVASGRDRAHRQRMGILAGAGIGVLASYFAASLHSCRGCENVAHERATWLVPLGVVTGAWVGARTGDERWTDLKWPP